MIQRNIQLSPPCRQTEPLPHPNLFLRIYFTQKNWCLCTEDLLFELYHKCTWHVCNNIKVHIKYPFSVYHTLGCPTAQHVIILICLYPCIHTNSDFKQSQEDISSLKNGVHMDHSWTKWVQIVSHTFHTDLKNMEVLPLTFKDKITFELERKKGMVAMTFSFLLFRLQNIKGVLFGITLMLILWVCCYHSF